MPQEEVPELLSDNESEPYPEDDIPQEDEEEEEDEDEEDDDYEEDYKVGRLNPSITPILGHSKFIMGESLFCALEAEPSFNTDSR